MVVSDFTVGGIYIVATLIALVTGVVLWRHRETTAARPLSVAGVSAAVWSFGLFLTTLPWEAVALAGIRVLYLGVAVGLPAVVVFALEYTGREGYVTPTVLKLLAIHPLLLVVFVFLNPGDLFFVSLDPAAPLGVDQQWGPAFWIHSTYAYLLVLITALLVADLLVRTNRALYRGQAVLLAAGVFAPLPMNAVFLSELVAFDTTPLGFVFMCAFFAVAIIKYRFVDLSPIAREKVIDTVRDGIVVVDTDDRIIDINPAGRKMINVEPSIIGSSVADALDLPESQVAYEELTETVDTSEQTVELGDVYYHIESTPIRDGRDHHVGWLFLLQDVTEQKRYERELEGQIEKLDEFASLVSHDLRSPINVANGYIEQTRITGDLDHLDDIERATERMEEIIDDVLELAREGQEVTEPEPVSVETIAREAWDHTETNGAALSIDGDARIIADPDRLTRLFENLMRNAIDHGTDGTADGDGDAGEADESAPLTIAVGIGEETPTKATIYVADDGVGIPESDRDRVLEDGYSTDDDGTGLGLAIVDQIVDAHGWTMAVTDSDSGGARFEIGDISKQWSAAD
ncbi:histidine kinase N-terminal 7TM domain-containing protein [Halohasta litorea]|uniref:histidine kinase n=1 Tax=Halohasta litorea TaxID=869891 RepID=A0ABD6D819_9EURY|nr:histidine kinase N-terminal 7TM domain-containing protein [Halohasta litorea]